MSTSKIAVLAILAALSWTTPALAQPAGDTSPAPIISEIVIPGTRPAPDEPGAGTLTDLTEYIQVVYNFLIAIVGMVAAVMMVVAGFQYLSAGGDPGAIGAAKKKIANALVGLVLALGAFTLLNTINPALLKFKPLVVADVKTEISLVAWCDTLIAEGTAVTPVGTGTDCGSVGTYATSSNKDVQYCLYAGDCRARRDSVDTVDIGEEPDDDEKNGMYANCTQFASLDNKTIGEKSKADPNVKLAKCLYCAQITKRMAADIGYEMPTACKAWERSFESLKPKTYTYDGHTFENGFFHYCGSTDSGKYCVGAAINCMSVNSNEDDSVSNYDAGCEGYDEDPSPSWRRSEDAEGYATGRYNYDEEGLEDYPDHLGAVCYANPCVNYVDPTNGKAHFFGGCKSGNGLIYATRRGMSKGDFSPDDCRNR